MNKNKNILVISQYFYPENFRINDICQEWINKGHNVTVLTGIPNYPEGKFYSGYGLFKNRTEIWNGINIIRIPLIPRGKNPLMLVLNYLSFPISGYFWNKKNNVKYDLVFMFETSPMNQCKIGVYYKKKHHAPLYLYVQDLWPENVEVIAGIKNKLIINHIQRMVNNIYNYCDGIFFTSKSFVELSIKKGLDKNKAYYLPQYAEDYYCQGYEKKNNDLFTIIFAGNVGYAQGLDILPRTAKLLKNKYSDKQVKFMIVGDGRYMTEFKKEISNVEDMFEFKGRVSPEEVSKYLKQADVAFLSFQNNDLWKKTIPAKLQTYMSASMPILGSVEGESERIINDAGCGLCSKLGDEEELCNNIIKIMSMNLTKLGDSGFKYCENHFSKKKILDYLDNIIIKND